jgi:thioredoxin-related protein
MPICDKCGRIHKGEEKYCSYCIKARQEIIKNKRLKKYIKNKGEKR